MLLRVKHIVRLTGAPRRTAQHRLSRMVGVFCLLGERGGPLAISPEDYRAATGTPAAEVMAVLSEAA